MQDDAAAEATPQAATPYEGPTGDHEELHPPLARSSILHIFIMWASGCQRCCSSVGLIARLSTLYYAAYICCAALAAEVATFAAGCFWCTEAIFRALRGVVHVVPGYAGGSVTSPTYEQVGQCT